MLGSCRRLRNELVRAYDRACNAVIAGASPDSLLLGRVWRSSMVTASLHSYTSGANMSSANQNCRAHAIWPERPALERGGVNLLGGIRSQFAGDGRPETA